jgi:uncharacterized protein
MRLFVDPWDPAYGVGVEATETGPDAPSSAEVDPDVELPAAAWRALPPPAGLAAPDVVLLVDGVRRIDARVWMTDDADVTHPGIAASYAAGVVRCDLEGGVAGVVSAAIDRGLFTSAPAPPGVGSGPLRYAGHHVRRGEPTDLVLAVQRQLQALEVRAASDARQGSDDLLLVDGPLRGRAHLPRTLGYIKTQHSQYLPTPLSAVVASLPHAHRSPVFALGTSWQRHTWYLRLPGPSGAAWAGVVRLECSAELAIEQAVALADVSTVLLPRLASSSYKDPRAPQNLIPIAGLERRLRGLLGDSRLLHRSLVKAAVP